ncbi:hypothetical protein [Magnetospira sp. QH-2]|uniref:hypothetical protein n=1 Tax=Magnetospira sp. (strain QH-2) TaxID=1288970 RepID=UPI00130E8644|nr:hypothetical protein [Magnetospira sp. QH-2]
MFAAFIGYAAMKHDPQHEFSSDLAHFGLLLTIGFGTALSLTVSISAVIEGVYRLIVYRKSNRIKG